jgi:hypothetical protein
MSRTVFLALLVAAASPTWGAWAAPKVEDRYGPAPPTLAARNDAPPLALLNWPGKAVAAAPVSHEPGPAPVTPAAASHPVLPTSLYAPAQPVATGPAPRRYSVHRDFGLNPDPAPLPPQFFADAAPDLAEPPPPPPVTAPTGQTAAAITARNRAADASSQVN